MTALILAAALASQCADGTCTLLPAGGFVTRYRGYAESSYQSSAPMAYEAIPRARIGPSLDLDVWPDIPLAPGEILVPSSVRVRVLPYAIGAPRPILRAPRYRYRERHIFRTRAF